MLLEVGEDVLLQGDVLDNSLRESEKHSRVGNRRCMDNLDRTVPRLTGSPSKNVTAQFIGHQS